MKKEIILSKEKSFDAEKRRFGVVVCDISPLEMEKMVYSKSDFEYT